MHSSMAEFPLKSVAKNASQNDRRNRMNSGTQWPFEEWPNPRECIEEWIAELPTPERRRHEMVPISARNGRNLKMDPNGRTRKGRTHRRMAENEQRHSKGRPFRLPFRDPALAQPAANPSRDSAFSQPVWRPLRDPVFQTPFQGQSL